MNFYSVSGYYCGEFIPEIQWCANTIEEVIRAFKRFYPNLMITEIKEAE